MKVGIPRGLYFYYYKDLLLDFFSNLGVEVIISPETNKEILDLGLKHSQDEMCMSLKIFIGHVIYLMDKCDYILIPRIDNYGIDNQTCTNFLAIYDIINNLIDTKILNYNINLNKNETEKMGFINIGKTLGYKKDNIEFAYIKAQISSHRKMKENIYNNIKKLSIKKKKILLIGHPYNLYDNLIGKPIVELIENLDVEIIYSNLFSHTDKYKNYAKELYWYYSKDNIGSIDNCINNIDGIIFLSSFPCGIDSLVNELVLRKLNKPYINLIVDDNMIYGGIETRIESFIDII